MQMDSIHEFQLICKATDCVKIGNEMFIIKSINRSSVILFNDYTDANCK